MPTVFTTCIRPAGQGGDFTSLNAWEAGLQSDLTSSSNLVYSGILSGTGISSTVNLYSNGINMGVLGAGRTSVLNSGLIYVTSIESNTGYYPQVGDYWTGAGSSFTLSTTGDTPIMYAQIDGTWTGADADSVAIAGWQTSPTNYIEIRPDTANRHSGVWDETKYRMKPYLSGGAVIINLMEAFVRVYGLQIGNSNPNAKANGINFSNSELTGERIIVQNIISGRGIRYAINDNDIPATQTKLARIENNAFINTYGNTDGMVFLLSSGYYIINNNTVIFGDAVTNRGIWFQYPNTPAYLNNNLVISRGAGACFGGNFNTVTSSNYNASSDATADDKAGVGNRINQTFLFVDSGAGNYMLSPYDTGALMRGTPLNASGFDTDIVGIYRGTGSVWDIGAFHSPTVIRTIKPAGQSGNYISLNAWEAAMQMDLVSGVNKSSYAEIGGNWTGVNSNVAIAGWETSSEKTINIYTTGDARHSGIWNTGKFCLLSSANSLYLDEGWVVIDGLQVGYTGTNTFNGVIYNFSQPADTSTYIKNCIVKLDAGCSGNGIYWSSSTKGNVYVYNTVIYNVSGTSKTALRADGIPTSLFADNMTLYNCTKGFRPVAGISTIRVRNCLTQNCLTGFDTSSRTFDADSCNNVADAGQFAPGTNPKSGTVTFIDAANGDFRLSSLDTVAKGYGTGLSSLFTTDIAGNTRTEPWDIGAWIWVEVSTPSGAVQYAIPCQDVSLGGWGDSPLYQKVSGFSSDTTDWIYSSLNPTNDTCEVLLSGVTNPSTYTGHVIKYTYEKETNNTGQIDLTISLYQGTTLIAETSQTDIPYGAITGLYTLTTGEAATITDYSDLRIRIKANKA